MWLLGTGLSPTPSSAAATASSTMSSPHRSPATRRHMNRRAERHHMRPWETPELTGWRRLPAHAVPRKGISLDGLWRFQLLPTPDADLAARWAQIVVPSCWTMQDFEDIHGVADLPQYTNYDMPWPALPPMPPSANPTGVYEREVEVPAEWAGRRMLLHVGAAESVLIASVNGVEVGIGKDSHLASEFDVTSAVRPGAANTVRLTVVKWSDATFVEDQDQWWHAGITRSVFLYSTGTLYIADLRVTASRDGQLSVDVEARSADGLLPEGWRVSAALDGGDAGPPRAGRAPAPSGRFGRRRGVPAGRFPRRRHRGHRPAHQRRARLHQGGQPARLPPGDRAGGLRRGHAGRPGHDEALRVQRGTHLALPQPPRAARPGRRARSLRRGRGRYRVPCVRRDRP